MHVSLLCGQGPNEELVDDSGLMVYEYVHWPLDYQLFVSVFSVYDMIS
jgi:hypothetical protein